MANQLVVYLIICSADHGQVGGLGAIINFFSAIIVVQLDDIIVKSAKVHNLIERFDDLGENSGLNEDNEKGLQTTIEPRFEDCGFLKVRIKKKHLMRGEYGVSVFNFHKLLFIAGLLLAIAFDIRNQQSLKSDWSGTPMLLNEMGVTASSEKQGTEISHALLNATAYNFSDGQG